jgi:hypothetical protein
VSDDTAPVKEAQGMALTRSDIKDGARSKPIEQELPEGRRDGLRVTVSQVPA